MADATATPKNDANTDQMDTVTLPGRKRKAAAFTPDQVATAIDKLGKVNPGQGVVIDKTAWYDTEAKARTKAREMALLIVAHPSGKNLPQPKTHVIPNDQGNAWSPVISPGKVK